MRTKEINVLKAGLKPPAVPEMTFDEYLELKRIRYAARKFCRENSDLVHFYDPKEETGLDGEKE